MTSEKEQRLLRRYPWLAAEGDRAPTTFVTDDLVGGRFDADPTEHVWFEQIRIRDADFTDLRFGDAEGAGGFHASSCLFEKCDFSGAAFNVAQLGWGGRTIYRGCRFDGAAMEQVLGRSPLLMAFSLGEARFEECTFAGAKIRGWLAHEADFVDCRFVGTIDTCRFFGTAPERRWFRRIRNEYRGNDFREVDFVWTRFEAGIPIDRQQWPEGREYVRLDRVRERTARVGSAIRGWPENEQREASFTLKELREIATNGQTEVFQRRVEPDEPPERATIQERVWSLLEEPLPL